MIVAPRCHSSRRGDDVQLAVMARDPDGEELTYFAEGLPESLSIDPERGLVQGKLAQAGSYQVTIRAGDGQLEAMATF